MTTFQNIQTIRNFHPRWVTHRFYPMTKTQFMQKRGVGKSMIFAGCLNDSYWSWDKSKIPCLSGNCTCPNSVHHQNQESTQQASSCFPGPDDAPHWEMCDSSMGMDCCYIPTTYHICRNRGKNSVSDR